MSQITGKKVGIDVGDPRDFKTFDELYDAFKKQYEYIVNRFLWLGTVAQGVEPQYLRFPFNSCHRRAPAAWRRARTSSSPTRTAPTASATGRSSTRRTRSPRSRSWCSTTRALTMDELLQALDSNFEGENGEKIRQMCLAAPKFGNDIDEADLMVRDVGAFSGGVIRSYKNPFDLPCKISREGLSWHYFGGLGVGALAQRAQVQGAAQRRLDIADARHGQARPDRRAAVGAQGRLQGVVRLLPQPEVLVDRHAERARAGRSWPSLTDTFFRNGGQHIQFNLVDREELLDAKAHPEKHSDLVVRVGGFSAYFVMLSPEIQDDVIYRSEQGC